MSRDSGDYEKARTFGVIKHTKPIIPLELDRNDPKLRGGAHSRQRRNKKTYMKLQNNQLKRKPVLVMYSIKEG
jgi:hypothetical protein